MGFFMGYGANQPRLVIVVPGARYSGAHCHAGPSAITPHQQPAAQHATVIQRHFGMACLNVLGFDCSRCDLGNQVGGLHRIKQRAAQVAVFQHMAHRTFAYFVVIKVHKLPGRAFTRPSVGNLDIKHRLGLSLHSIPNAQHFKHPHRSQRKRISPPVKRRFTAGCQWHSINNNRRKPAGSKSQCQRGAVEPAANYDDIRIHFHRAI